MYRSKSATGRGEDRLGDLLGRLFDVVPDLPVPHIPDALGDVERLRTALWARLLQPGAATPAAPAGEERLLGVAEAARLLGVSKTALRRLQAGGQHVGVRIGRRLLFRRETLLRFAGPAGSPPVGPAGRPRWAFLVPVSSRSIVDALAASNFSRTVAASVRCPWRSKAATRIGSSGFSRLPHTRSEASQRTTSASRTASS
jgi:excisionase family DNA binding protein